MTSHRVERGGMCYSIHAGYFCTQPAGHDGYHKATDTHGNLVRIWSEEAVLDAWAAAVEASHSSPTLTPSRPGHRVAVTEEEAYKGIPAEWWPRLTVEARGMGWAKACRGGRGLTARLAETTREATR